MSTDPYRTAPDMPARRLADEMRDLSDQGLEKAIAAAKRLLRAAAAEGKRTTTLEAAKGLDKWLAREGFLVEEHGYSYLRVSW